MRKHYVPAFCRKDAEGREQSVCGQFITMAERLKPGERTDCWGCNLWFHEVEHPSTQRPARWFHSWVLTWGGDAYAFHL